MGFMLFIENLEIYINHPTSNEYILCLSFMKNQYDSENLSSCIKLTFDREVYSFTNYSRCNKAGIATG